MNVTTFSIIITIVLIVLIVFPTRQRKQEAHVPPTQQTQATSLAAQPTQEKNSPKRHLGWCMINDIRLTQLMLVLTLITSILFLREEVQLSVIKAIDAGKYWLAAEGWVLVSIVVFQVYGYFIYYLTRMGYFKRITFHKAVSHKELEEFIYKQQVAPPLAILIPSYKEDVQVIKQTLLSAALQEYPHRHVILLIDDPPSPGNWEESMKLIAARNAPYQIHLLLSEQDKRLRSAWQSFVTRLSQGCLDRATEMARLAALYQEVAQWFKRQAETYPIRNHTDDFFVHQILLQPCHEFWLKAQELQNPEVMLSPAEVDQEYRRLASLFHVELSSFERKKYHNLSHEPNKAMNLNSYMGLLGKSFQAVQKDTGLFLEEVTPSPNALHFPDAKYLITLDADSLLLPSYALRLVHFMEQPGNEKIAVAQTVYSAIPNAPRILERIAGATTDIQCLMQQGSTYYQATFWVGANALLRKAALEDIGRTTLERGFEVTRYIQDRTLTEDSDSTIDLLEKGWQLHNYPARLAYSATPADFGALLIQRRRWASGGLLILPKLLRLLLCQPHRLRVIAEWNIRLYYLISTCGTTLCLLLLLSFPFDQSLYNAWLPWISLPYCFLLARDLVKIGRRKSDLLAVYVLNVMLLPVQLGGILMSLYQGVTGKKFPFSRTPKVKERTCVPRHYILLELALLLYCLFLCIIDVLSTRFLHAFYTGINAMAFLSVFTWFIGWKESKEDLFRPRTASRHGPKRAVRVSKAIVLLLASLVFLIITFVISIPTIAK